MKFSVNVAAGSVEFLAADDFVAIPVKLSANTLAGTVVVYDGVTGLLLYDLDVSKNPNGAMLVQGVVDQKKAEAHSGATITSTNKAAMPGIVFRNNIGVNADET